MKRLPMLTAVTAAALLPFSLHGTAAAGTEQPIRLAMMDMMPMGGGTQPMPQEGTSGMQVQGQGQMPMGGVTQQPMPQQAPGGMPDNSMMGAGRMQAQGQRQMPMGGVTQPPIPQQAPGGMTDNGMMGMGSMSAQGQMPMPGAAQQPMDQSPMAGCMTMMQNMMRMGSAQGGMQQMQGGSPGTTAGMGATPPMGSSAARLEGRIAFLRTELRITDAQAPAWDAFATSLRAGREHLDAARAALQEGTTSADPMARLESHERHLRERAEAMHMTRMAFNTLYAQLDDAQKRIATVTMLPFIGAY